MINIIKERITEYLATKGVEDTSKFSMEIPKNILNGQLSMNLLMTYGKFVNKEEIFPLLESIPMVAKVSYAHPGFINIFFKSEVIKDVEHSWQEVQQKKNINISVEYASPNPTGPCHIGHARGSITGDIISSILTHLGYNVRKDCIFNDGGKQVEKFIESIYLRYKELRGETSEEELVNIFYKGAYVKDLAQAYVQEKNLTFGDFLNKKDKIMEVIKINMKADLKLLQIEHDTITDESKLENERKICWQQLQEEGLLEFETTEKGDKIYFKSKDFEDDKDRVIEREDGTITYFGNDIAYHWKKKQGLSQDVYNEQIIVLGDDHIGYLKRLLGAVSNFGIQLRVYTHNLVKIIQNGMEVKMSKRNGNFITIRDFLEDYGNGDILRILMMEQGSRSVVNLDLNKLNLEDSPLFYIQYAYTRIYSILHKAQIIYHIDQIDFTLLTEKEEIWLIGYLVYWPELIERVGKSLDVHGLFVYLREFVQIIHSYLSNCKIIDENNLNKQMEARLFLIKKCQRLLETILRILKITPLTHM